MVLKQGGDGVMETGHSTLKSREVLYSGHSMGRGEGGALCKGGIEGDDA